MPQATQSVISRGPARRIPTDRPLGLCCFPGSGIASSFPDPEDRGPVCFLSHLPSACSRPRRGPTSVTRSATNIHYRLRRSRTCPTDRSRQMPPERTSRSVLFRSARGELPFQKWYGLVCLQPTKQDGTRNPSIFGASRTSPLILSSTSPLPTTAARLQPPQKQVAFHALAQADVYLAHCEHLQRA